MQVSLEDMNVYALSLLVFTDGSTFHNGTAANRSLSPTTNRAKIIRIVQWTSNFYISFVSNNIDFPAVGLLNQSCIMLHARRIGVSHLGKSTFIDFAAF